MSEKAPCRLYLISPPELDLEIFGDALKGALEGGDVACFQLRLKQASDDDIRRATEILMPIVQSFDAAYLINDRPDLAAELKADGVHIGQEDSSYATARKLMGPDRIVGVTCHASRHLAMEAGEAGADYIAFGAFFPTITKEAKFEADPDILTWWSELFEIPSVAIGGITVENAGILVKAGADFLAVSGGVWNYPAGPAAAVRSFNEVFLKD